MLGFALGCGAEPNHAPGNLADLFPANPSSLTTSDNEEWTAAMSPRPFRFPADHAAHDDFRLEWWYYTGNLETENGRHFGYQLTFFRTGFTKSPKNPSRWAVRDLYTAHFAISDVESRQHYCLQRNSRQGIDQAGAEVHHYEVWNGGWRAWLDHDSHRLQAAESGLGIDLTLSPARPPVLHGDNGLSRKGPTSGNASYYYSVTRLATHGTLSLGGETFAVKGTSWMDHEFSTSFLEPTQRGWDWLSIQLDNDTDLMLYRMRRMDGTTDPFSSGSLVGRDGSLTPLSLADFQMTPLRNWTSPQTGAVYPLDWRIEIPRIGCQLEIRPVFDSQEMTTDSTTGINYWEGAIEVAGRSNATRVAGRGYMELTGYGGRGLGSLLD